MSFKWHTDEERGWERETLPGGASDKNRSRGRLGRAALIFAALLLSTAAAWRGVQERVARNMQALEQEVHSSYLLAQRAAQTDDEELLLTVLSGRDEGWAALQGELLQDGLLLSEAAAPLGLVSAEQEGAITALAWSPDLQAVEVTSRHTYRAPAAMATEPVVLEQTLVFRRGEQRWLLSPPDDAAWGLSAFQQGRFIRLTYRERDAEAATALLPILDDAVARLCRTLARPCMQGQVVTVNLSAEGRALRRLRDGRYGYFRRGNLTLPAPSLVGEGVDAASRQALFEGYAVHVVVAATRVLVDYDCCAGAPFLDTLAVELARELGYGDGQVQPPDYVAMASQLPTLEHFRRLWWGAVDAPFTDRGRQDAGAFVAFLQRHSGASASALLQALAETSGFWEWGQPFLSYDVAAERTALETSWREFVLAQASATQRHLPAFAGQPEQALKLVCTDSDGQHGVYGYDPRADSWSYERAVQARAPALVPTPDDEGAVLFDRVTGDPSRLPARLLQDDQAMPLPGDLAPAYSLASDPQGRFMSMWRVAQSGRTVDGAVLLDVESCFQERGCRERSLEGLPAWSPSGEQLLVWAPETGSVTRMSRDFRSVDRSGLRSAQQPFWLDEQSVGLIAQGGETIQVVQLGASAPWTPQTLLALSPVLTALGRDGDGRSWRFAQAFAIPGASWSIAGAVTLPQSEARHYFAAHFDEQWRLREIFSLTYAPQLTVTSPEALISADGAWLALHLAPEALFEARFVLHDLRTGKVVLETRSPYFTLHRAFDWSAGGKWLARIGQNQIELTTASGDAAHPLLRRFVSSGQLQCSSVAWVRR